MKNVEHTSVSGRNMTKVHQKNLQRNPSPGSHKNYKRRLLANLKET